MSKEALKELFTSFGKKNVMIIGDVMIDAYLMGRVERISPEAPVPVVSVFKKENRLGGAANVALNIQAMGATPLLCSVTGDDTNSKTFLDLLRKNKMRTDGILISHDRSTTVKTRVVGSKHQMLRIDEETEESLSSRDYAKLSARIAALLKKEKIDVIIFEDYDKGVISAELIDFVVKEAARKNIPVTVDPKKKNFNEYTNVTLFKPNLRELLNGIKADFDETDHIRLKKEVLRFTKKQKIAIALVTLSEEGILVVTDKIQSIIPAHVRSISDVSGAGDTVAGVAALCLACGLAPETLAALANLAGGLVCEKAGVVPVDKKQLLQEAIRLGI